METVGKGRNVIVIPFLADPRRLSCTLLEALMRRALSVDHTNVGVKGSGRLMETYMLFC